MIYLLLFVYIVVYSYIVSVQPKKGSFIFYFIPIAILLVMVSGLQDSVGTDYESYLNLVDGARGMGWIEKKNEFFFIFLISIVKNFNNLQLIFGLTGAIQVLFLGLISYEIKKMNYELYHFFFLYFALSLTFFNQFNLIRQYIAVYIVIYALLELMNNKSIKFIILVFMASLFHHSAILFLVFLPAKGFLSRKYSSKIIIIIMGVLLLLSTLDMSKYVELVLSHTRYSNYVGSSYSKRIDIQGIITKIPKIFMVLMSVCLIDKGDLEDKEIQLINLSYIGLGMQILSFTSSLIWRFYQYVDLYIIFPVLILFNNKSWGILKMLISIISIALLVTKIIVIPRGEYLYRSILF